MHCNGGLNSEKSSTTGSCFRLAAGIALLLISAGSHALTTVTPTSIDLGNLAANTPSQAQTITVATDWGANNITVSALAFSPPRFDVVNNCPTNLDNDSSCTITVTFLGGPTGVYSQSITVSGDDTVSESPFSQVVSVAARVTSEGSSGGTILDPYTGGDPSAKSTASAITSACASGNISSQMQADCDALLAAAGQSDPNTGNALSLITPERATKSNQVTRQGGQSQSRNIGARTSALRSGVTGLSFQGLNINVAGKQLPVAQLANSAYLGQLGGGASADDLLAGSKVGLFVTGDLAWGDRDSSDIESGLDFKTHGVTVGLDYRFSDRFVLGAAIGYMDTHADLDNNSGDLDVRGYSLSLYGTYYTEDAYFVDFSATYGKNDFGQTRNLRYSLGGGVSVDQKLGADYNGDLYSLTLGAGYDFNQGAWSFGPRIDIEYTRSEADGFSETISNPLAPGGGWATSIEDTEQDWLTLQVGGKLAYTHSASWGILIPYGRLDWLHEFKGSSQTITGHFVDDPDKNALEIFSDDPDRDYLRLRIGTSAQFRNGVSVFLDYGTILSNSLWHEQTLSTGFRMEF